MKHGNTGKRNAAKAPEDVKSITRVIRFTKVEIKAHNAARQKKTWTAWVRGKLSEI